MNTETGAASIRIELRGGGVQVLHGEDGAVLHSFPVVPEGTWSEMFDSIITQLSAASQKV